MKVSKNLFAIAIFQTTVIVGTSGFFYESPTFDAMSLFPPNGGSDERGGFGRGRGRGRGRGDRGRGRGRGRGRREGGRDSTATDTSPTVTKNADENVRHLLRQQSGISNSQPQGLEAFPPKNIIPGKPNPLKKNNIIPGGKPNNL